MLMMIWISQLLSECQIMNIDQKYFCISGEWLMAVNDLEIDFDNIDNILSSIRSPKQV